ncbi:MAG TPA: M1 family aminopeptidase [Thermoanaerobaculia bacterium]|nr:M1 family aminopeptidase [Thermoanaerobaculia bacterium]
MLHTVRRLAVVATFVAATLAAADDPTYTAVRSARLDGRKISVTNFTFDRDVFHVTLNGTLHLLAPVDNKTFGAVFVGQGSYQLKPASPSEMRQLALYANDDKLEILSDTFDDAVFFAAGLIDAAQKASPAQTGAADSRAASVYDDYVKRQKKDLHTNVHARVLQELLNGSAEPLFFAWVDGKKYPPAVIATDPLGWETLARIGIGMGGEQSVMWVVTGDHNGFWYSSRLRSEIEKGQGVIIPRLADAEHYLIDINIQKAEINGSTTMTFIAGPNVRLLPIELARRVRISSADISPASATPAWTPAAWVQEKYDEDPDASVIFATPLKTGEKYLLKIGYGGKEVLEDAGDGNFSVGARTSWYPNVGVFEDTATYELHFRVPQKFQIVAVGEETENRVDGDSRIAVWKATHPIRVAGFNYGKFKKLSQTDKDSGMTVDVYTNPGTPQIITEINRAIEGVSVAGFDDDEDSGPSGPSLNVDTAKLAQSAMADGINTARTGNAFFGPLAEKRVAITQQSQWFFGQSWPSLIYMPYLAFLNGMQRNTLGLTGIKDFIDEVGPHEFGHQWWGHQVGTRSYRDEWISEGFAHFTAALVVQQTGGWNKYNAFWERQRKNILEKGFKSTITPDQAGPISQGWRLATWQSPGAYDSIVYSKGAYILHMLRMTMQDRSKPIADEAFMAMMREFATTYAGKNASTGDFQRVLEKYATPSLKLTKDGKLDWFFRQWVYGTAIPRYASKIDFQDIGGGKYKISGTITQSEVPADFAAVVPIYVYFDKNNFAQLGKVPIVGSTTQQLNFEIALPKKPQKFAINALHDVLAR